MLPTCHCKNKVFLRVWFQICKMPQEESVNKNVPATDFPKEDTLCRLIEETDVVPGNISFDREDKIHHEQKLRWKYFNLQKGDPTKV